MKTAAAAKRVVIQETSLEKLMDEMAEWSIRVAKRAYEFFAASGFTHGHDIDDWFRAEQELFKPVPCEIKDSTDELVVRAEVTGFDAKDLDVHLSGRRLVIAGQRDEAEEKGEKACETARERKFRRVYRMLELPAAVRADKSRAALNNGVLELTLPKAEKAKATAA
jgi:HSP20 family protein